MSRRYCTPSSSSDRPPGKPIAAYAHPGEPAPGEPDTQPGNYYVTILHEAKGTCLALGPFPNDHTAALAAVEPVRTLCCNADGRMWFDCSWGTARFAEDFITPGKLNGRFPSLFPDAPSEAPIYVRQAT